MWNPKAQSIKGNSEEAKAINRQLSSLKAELHKHYSLLVTLGKPVTAEAVKNSYLGIIEHQRTLCEAFDFHNRRFAEKVKAGKKYGIFFWSAVLQAMPIRMYCSLPLPTLF